MVEELRLLKFYTELTPRQREVLQLVSAGYSNGEAAKHLYIQPSVVAGHLTKIYEELGIVEGVSEIRPTRYLVVRLFGDFFQRYPELDNFAT